MSKPDRDNPYAFDPFLAWRQEVDYYAHDAFLQAALKTFAGDQWEAADKAAREISPKVSHRWRDMADRIARPENQPSLQAYDAHRHRIDRLVRPLDIEVMEREVFSEGLFSERTPAWVRLIKQALIYENGEACIACPLVCTEGMVALLDQFADSDELRAVRRHVKEGVEGDFAIGAQYLSEVQGGSDVPANLLEAIEDGDGWRIFGSKFFCSATHADYAVVTAKPRDSEQVGLFIVPSWLPGDKAAERRNGFTIDRIKWKMGTAELPTCEITFDGAVAYPIGPLARGLANVVGIVLTTSRLTVGLSSAASMLRAQREAAGYARFREAFGLRLDSFPMVAAQLAKLERDAQRTTAGAFKLYRDVQALPGGLKGGLKTDEDARTRRLRFDVRELIMLQKIATAYDAPDHIRLAISIFGGHGVIEDFSSLPRLFRDAAVNELWEGPRNVLLTQIYRDLMRVADWYPASEWLESVLAGASAEVIEHFQAELAELADAPDLTTVSPQSVAHVERWDGFCQDLFHTYQDQALAEVELG